MLGSTQANFQRLKLLGDNAGNCATRRKTGPRRNTHQSDTAPAIDHRDAVLCEKDADCRRNLSIFLIVAGP